MLVIHKMAHKERGGDVDLRSVTHAKERRAHQLDIRGMMHAKRGGNTSIKIYEMIQTGEKRAS